LMDGVAPAGFAQRPQRLPGLWPVEAIHSIL
jgi:hypothetical protein